MPRAEAAAQHMMRAPLRPRILHAIRMQARPGSSAEAQARGLPKSRPSQGVQVASEP
jgi:hypothetical protein